MLRTTFAAVRRAHPRFSTRAFSALARSSTLSLRYNAPKPCVPVRYQSSAPDNTATFKVDNPQMMIAFTCKKCDTRSSHTFSKQSYYKGTVLIQCPGCKNRHLIADNLKVFKDNKFSLEDVLKASGESVTTTPGDLAFEDIPEKLRSTIGHYAKDAPEEYRRKQVEDQGLPEGKSKE